MWCFNLSRRATSAQKLAPYSQKAFRHLQVKPHVEWKWKGSKWDAVDCRNEGFKADENRKDNVQGLNAYA